MVIRPIQLVVPRVSVLPGLMTARVFDPSIPVANKQVKFHSSVKVKPVFCGCCTSPQLSHCTSNEHEQMANWNQRFLRLRASLIGAYHWLHERLANLVRISPWSASRTTFSPWILMLFQKSWHCISLNQWNWNGTTYHVHWVPLMTATAVDFLIGNTFIQFHSVDLFALSRCLVPQIIFHVTPCRVIEHNAWIRSISCNNLARWFSYWCTAPSSPQTIRWFKNEFATILQLNRIIRSSKTKQISVD